MSQLVCYILVNAHLSGAQKAVQAASSRLERITSGLTLNVDSISTRSIITQLLI